MNVRPFAGSGLGFAKRLDAVATRSTTLDEATQAFEAWLRSAIGQ
ncbi:MAG: hypothetical protein ACYDBJ_10390 [Aggregatilineales bacterium]